ncbi:tetratricopeptide repeat protein [Gilvimarinus chinensis]|uniref:tetratricopeptide repeat protein n=1 Tax=Gilvimarinus chinensis TaxID=396005 RepID=UPI00036B3945|nr:tetratricopeptide repeat protein [Gilvimarinus chinensis]
MKDVNKAILMSGVLLMLLGGCSTTSGPGAPVSDAGGAPAPPSQRQPEQEQAPEPETPQRDNGGWQITQPPAERQTAPNTQPATPRAAGTNSAVNSLLNQADGYYQQADFSRAIASAERALRIDRRSAKAYLMLAQSYWQMGGLSQAEQFARQGLRYAGDDRALTRALNSVLAEVE